MYLHPQKGELLSVSGHPSSFVLNPTATETERATGIVDGLEISVTQAGGNNRHIYNI